VWVEGLWGHTVGATLLGRVGRWRQSATRQPGVSYYTPRVLRIADTALKHGYSREEVSHAYDMAVYEGVVNPDAEQPKLLTIGPDSAGNLLELIGGPRPNEEHLIWHAMRCRAKYLALLPSGGR
jgi:hypothetical protein